MNCCYGSRALTNPAPVPGELLLCRCAPNRPPTFEPKRASLLLLQAGSAPHRPRRLWTKSVGELSTGACIGTHFPQLLYPSRLRLCRRGYSLVLQSAHSALHLFVEEVTPVIHHRLKLWSGNQRVRRRFEPLRTPYGDRPT